MGFYRVCSPRVLGSVLAPGDSAYRLTRLRPIASAARPEARRKAVEGSGTMLATRKPIGVPLAVGESMIRSVAEVSSALLTPAWAADR